MMHAQCPLPVYYSQILINEYWKIIKLKIIFNSFFNDHKLFFDIPNSFIATVHGWDRHLTIKDSYRRTRDKTDHKGSQYLCETRRQAEVHGLVDSCV